MGTIRHDYFWDAQAFHRSRGPGAGTGAKSGFLFQSHLINDGLDILHKFSVYFCKEIQLGHRPNGNLTNIRIEQTPIVENREFGRFRFNEMI
jgi:hypothetical protein